jgi:hypothetical protein
MVVKQDRPLPLHTSRIQWNRIPIATIPKFSLSNTGVATEASSRRPNHFAMGPDESSSVLPQPVPQPVLSFDDARKLVIAGAMDKYEREGRDPGLIVDNSRIRFRGGLNRGRCTPCEWCTKHGH